MSAVVVNIHLGGLVVVQLLPDVGFILQNKCWDMWSETYICWLYPAKQLLRPLVKADSRCMLSEIFVKKKKKKRESSPLVWAKSMCSEIFTKNRERKSSPLVWAESRACPPFCRIRGTASLRYSRWTWLSATRDIQCNHILPKIRVMSVKM